MYLGLLKNHLVYFMATSGCAHCGMWFLESQEYRPHHLTSSHWTLGMAGGWAVGFPTTTTLEQGVL